MTTAPRSIEEIYTSLRDRLTDNIPGLTNFVETSFNYVWTRAFSREFREIEIGLLSSEMAAWVDFAGGPIDDQKLQQLGVSDNVSADELDLEDDQLDNLVELVGVSRDQGNKASGQVTFTTQSSLTDIPEGTPVGTEPDSTGDFLEFVTDEQVSTLSGETTATVDITASEVGSDYNSASAGTITYLPSPPPGIISVTNTSGVQGGEDIESNEELRERAKKAIFTSSGGGTVEGLSGFIEDSIEDVRDVEVIEKFQGDSIHGDYPHGHVVVDGGESDQDVLDAIQSGRPVSVRHILIRPEELRFRVDANVEGTGIDTSQPGEEVTEYISNLDIGSELVWYKLAQRILNSDPDITDIEMLSLFIEDEEEYFDEQRISNFDDSDTTVNPVDWSGWSGDTGSLTAQQSTTISGSHTGQLSASNANVSVHTEPSSGTTQRSVRLSLQIDNQSGNASDVITVEPRKSGSSRGLLTFDGSGSVYWDDTSSTTSVGSWSAGDTYDITLDFDYSNDQVDVTFDGTTTTAPLNGTDENWDRLTISNDSTASTQTTNLYFDSLYLSKVRYPLSRGGAMDNNGVDSVTGISGSNTVTFTEGTDYDEIDLNNDSDDDAIIWSLEENTPDTRIERTKTIEYIDGTNIYEIGSDLNRSGILSVTGTLNEQSNTFTEGTDFEELDNNDDGSVDSIDWSVGGDSPDPGTEFEVTYEAGAIFRVTYKIADNEDVQLSETETPRAGNTNITVV